MSSNGVTNISNSSTFAGQPNWPNSRLDIPAFQDLTSRTNFGAVAQRNSPQVACWKGFPAPTLTSSPASSDVSEEFSSFRNTFLTGSNILPSCSSQPQSEYETHHAFRCSVPDKRQKTGTGSRDSKAASFWGENLGFNSAQINSTSTAHHSGGDFTIMATQAPPISGSNGISLLDS